MESWLSEDIEISIKNYDVVRLDRNRHGGGVLIYIHTSLTWEVLLRGPNTLEFLTLGHLVAFLNIVSQFCTVSHPLSVLHSSICLPIFLQTLYKLEISFCNKDFFCRLCNNYTLSMSQVVLSPTLTNSNGHASLIDLALVSSKTQLLDCSVTPPLVNADHNGLELSFTSCLMRTTILTKTFHLTQLALSDY